MQICHARKAMFPGQCAFASKPFPSLPLEKENQSSSKPSCKLPQPVALPDQDSGRRSEGSGLQALKATRHESAPS